MLVHFLALFGWMPPLLQILLYGVISVFVFVIILKVIRLILDVIPLL